MCIHRSKDIWSNSSYGAVLGLLVSCKHRLVFPSDHLYCTALNGGLEETSAEEKPLWRHNQLFWRRRPLGTEPFHMTLSMWHFLANRTPRLIAFVRDSFSRLWHPNRRPSHMTLSGDWDTKIYPFHMTVGVYVQVVSEQYTHFTLHTTIRKLFDLQ